LTSPYARPDRPPLEELERLLVSLEEELAGWRARAGKLGDSLAPRGTGRPGMGATDLNQARQRIGLLEGENHLLRQRIAAAREQVEQLRTRLRFIEERGTDAA
jgi:hypothetical protein